MANSMRVRKAVRVEHYPVASATVIEIGDMLYYDGTANEVLSLPDFVWDTDLATTQTAVALIFAGIALAASASGKTKDVRVATEGEAEMPCAAAAFNSDEFIGPDDNATPDDLLAQQVIGVATIGLAIGMASKVQASRTLCLFDFKSAIQGNKIS